MYKLLLCLLLVSCISTPKQSMDNWVRDRVFKLSSLAASCSAVEVRAPSKRIYMLTARHCQILDEDGYITAIAEDGKESHLKIIAKALDSDLMLLAPADDKAVMVAVKTTKHEHMWTMSHGRGLPSFRTDGEMIDTDVEFPTGDGTTIHNAMSTAHVEHGSSGGPALNDKGELIGIISTTDPTGFFSGMVPLSDIQSFLADK